MIALKVSEAGVRNSSIWTHLKEKKHKIIISLLYLVLLGIFIHYYFLGIFQEYLKGSTTFSSRTQEAEYLNGPQITLCFEPAYKPSVMDSNGLKDIPSFAYFLNINDSWNKYHELAYQLNTNIFFDLQLIMNASISKQYQKVFYEVIPIGTYRNGMCYHVKHSIRMPSAFGKFKLELLFDSNLTDLDLPAKVKMWLSSEQGWFGLILDDWPLISPTIFEYPIKHNEDLDWVIKLSSTEHVFQRGSIGFEKCFQDFIKQNVNCSKKCFPILYNFMDYLVEPCQSIEETRCMYDSMVLSHKGRYQCLSLQNISTFEGEAYTGSRHQTNKTKLNFIFYFAKHSLEIREETLVVSTESFIGSIGGSLGLFLGFSFFSYCSDFIHFCLSKI